MYTNNNDEESYIHPSKDAFSTLEINMVYSEIRKNRFRRIYVEKRNSLVRL
jgi:hypothetical protein